ncbi:hypothetical protein ACOZ38_29390 [Sphaerisporangium viridialbum]|uniref:hypothetical protein n=1 Tax=Sphaerisporangium viridialbum TaxID=46189 RepID=UPI003C751316
MSDLTRALASIAGDLAEHDQLTTELGEEASDYVEVKRADLDTLVAAAGHGEGTTRPSLETRAPLMPRAEPSRNRTPLPDRRPRGSSAAKREAR